MEGLPREYKQLSKEAQYQPRVRVAYGASYPNNLGELEFRGIVGSQELKGDRLYKVV